MNCEWFFTYKTPKLVSVRDKKLGILFNLLQLLVVIYLAVYVCAFKCKHLVKEKATGLTRLTIQQPTKGCNPLDHSCDSNFTAATKLPYCAQYNGDIKVPDRQECMFHDGVDISYEIPVPGTLFAISRYSKFKQKKDCDPESTDDFGCHGTLYRSAKEKQEETYYMADIERFTILLGHGFEASDDSGNVVSGQGAHLEGYMSPGGAKSEKLFNIKKKDSPLESAFRINGLGDVISIGDLLRLTSTNMDVTLDTIGSENMPLRYNGCIIVVHIEYTNRRMFDIFARAEPYYVMTAQKLKISEFKKMYRDDNEWTPVAERLVVDSHGVLIVVKLTGDIMFFSLLNLFQVLTTAIGFFAIARVISDWVMSNVMHHRNKYHLLKYQVAKDFENSAAPTSSAYHQLNHVSPSDEVVHDNEHSKLLKDCAHVGEPPLGEDLLHVLLNFEKRLNHLDGHDPDIVKGDTTEPINSRISSFEDTRRQNRPRGVTTDTTS
jgi:hypothetical protein